MESKIQVIDHVHCIEQSKERLQELGQLITKGKIQSCDVTTILDQVSGLQEETINIIKSCQKALIHAQNEQKKKQTENSKYSENLDSAPTPKTIQIQKGYYPVDTYVPNSVEYSVFQVNEEVYSKTLSHVNIKQNFNKFFILQVLQKKRCPDQFFVFFRWGRVGVPGQNCMIGPESQAIAINRFDQKFNQKVNNGQYLQIQMCFGGGVKQEILKNEIEDHMKVDKDYESLNFKQRLFSCLPKMLKDLLDMCKRMGLDTRKMPLNKINQKCIAQAYEVLQKISNQIRIQQTKNNIMGSSGEFYTLIPHDFGFSAMSKFILDSTAKISSKIQMLQCISDAIQILKYIEKGKHLFLDQIEFDIIPQAKETQIFHYYAKFIVDYACHSGWSLKNVYTIQYAAQYMTSPHNAIMFIQNSYYEVPRILIHGLKKPQHIMKMLSKENIISLSQNPKLPEEDVDSPVFLLIAKAINGKSNEFNLESESNLQLKVILEVKREND